MKKVVTIMSAIALVAGGAVLGIAAENGKEAIEAVLNHDISIMVNGEKLEIYDEATNEVRDPITYNDRTYVPIRFISEALGVAVDWDEATQTVFIGDKPVNIPEVTAAPVPADYPPSIIPPEATRDPSVVSEGTVTRTSGTRRDVEYTESGVIAINENTWDNIAVFEALATDTVPINKEKAIRDKVIDENGNVIIGENDGLYGYTKGMAGGIKYDIKDMDAATEYIKYISGILEAQGYKKYVAEGPGVVTKEELGSVDPSVTYRNGDVYVYVAYSDGVDTEETPFVEIFGVFHIQKMLD